MRHLSAHAAPRPPGIEQPRGRERGIMLVTVLWIVAILGLVVSAFNGNVRTGIAIRKNEIAMARIEARARDRRHGLSSTTMQYAA